MSGVNAPPAPGGTPWRVLCVDDEPNILSALMRLLRPRGYQVVTAGSGALGLEKLAAEPFDLVISDMRMPAMDGATFLARVREHWPACVRILLTGYADITATIAAINEGEIYRYIAKPWDDNDLLLVVRHALERKALEQEKARLETLTQRQNEALRDLNANLEQKVIERTEALRAAHEKLKTTFLTAIKVFANLIELRHHNLAGHSRRVAELARRIGQRMGLEGSALQDVFLAGLLHDIGKIGLSDTLLKTPEQQMSGEELAQFRQHPARGEQSLMALDDLRPAALLVRAHHERFDGGGYPDGLAGEEIPLGARILAVANDYDALQIGALSSQRYTAVSARQRIIDGGGRRYDPAVMDAFLLATEQDTPAAAEVVLTPLKLRPGMVLSRDLVSRDGILLLSAEHRLDGALVRQIRQYAQAEGMLHHLQVTLYAASVEAD